VFISNLSESLFNYLLRVPVETTIVFKLIVNILFNLNSTIKLTQGRLSVAFNHIFYSYSNDSFFMYQHCPNPFSIKQRSVIKSVDFSPRAVFGHRKNFSLYISL